MDRRLHEIQEEMKTLSKIAGSRKSPRFPLPHEMRKAASLLATKTQELLASTGSDARFFVILSHLFQWLHRYPQAIENTQAAIASSSETERKSLQKQLFRLRLEEEFWKRINLFPEQLESLANVLEKECGDDLERTHRWFTETGLDPTISFRYFHEMDIHSDFMLLQHLIDP